MPETIYPPGFPYQPKFITLDRVQIAYFDEGQGDNTLLMVHGNPVAGYVYARLMQQLLPGFRCVVPDLLGFGLSDKPTAVADYSLRKHIDLMMAFIQALNLRQVVLLVHDWGGPIGWGAAIQEPDRFTHLVVLNTLTEAPMKIMPIYKLPFHFFQRAGRLFDYFVMQKNMFQIMGIADMDKADQQVYFRANHSPETRAGIAAFPRMIPFNETHPTTAVLRHIHQTIEQWPIPTLVLYSDHDSVFSAEQGERFAARMQQATYKLIPGPKHFLQYQAAEKVAQEIKMFLNK